MKTRLLIILFLIIGIIGTMSILYAYQLPHYSLEIQGMKDTYLIGEEYSFYYTLSGFGNTCHSWIVSYPDQNGEIKKAGEAVDCSRHTNKELSYDSRKDLRKFSSLVPKVEGKYNVTVSLENIKPVIFEFSVMHTECDEGFKDVDGVCKKLGKISEKDIPVFFEIQLMELDIEWELADRSWANPDFEIVPPARICSHIIKESGAELYISTIWQDEYSLSDMIIQRDMPDDCVKFLPVTQIGRK